MKCVCSLVLVIIAASVDAIGPLGGFGVGVVAPKCEPTLTSASGSHVIHKPSGQFCSGDMIFEDTFDTFDLRKWQHENTLSGNGVKCNCLPAPIAGNWEIEFFSIGSSSGTRTTARIRSAKKAICTWGRRWRPMSMARCSWVRDKWISMDPTPTREYSICHVSTSEIWKKFPSQTDEAAPTQHSTDASASDRHRWSSIRYAALEFARLTRSHSNTERSRLALKCRPEIGFCRR